MTLEDIRGLVRAEVAKAAKEQATVAEPDEDALFERAEERLLKSLSDQQADPEDATWARADLRRAFRGRRAPGE